MPLFESIVDGIDAVLDKFASDARYSLGDYCDLETAEDEETLVARDGSLITLLEIRGVQTLTGSSTFVNQIVMPLKLALQSLFEGPAHQVQVWFEVDPDRTREELREVMQPAHETIKRLGMELEDMLYEREENLCHWTASERCFIALWTRPAALTKSEQKTEAKMSKERSKGKPRIGYGQNPLHSCSMLKNRHGSFVDQVRSELGSSHLVAVKLSSRRALREIRRSIDPGFTSDDWDPCLPGDPVMPTVRRERVRSENWEIMWPPLSTQLAPRDAKIVGSNQVEIGDRVYAPLYIELFPRDPSFFSKLFARAKEKKLPWRISFLMEGDGLSGLIMKKMMAKLMSYAGEGNKMLNRSIEDLQQLQNDLGEPVVKVRVALCTWAPRRNRELLDRRSSDLARCVEGWGSSQVSEITGDPIGGVVSTSLAFCQGSVATKASAPMAEVMQMMPLSRPSSPWPTGAVTFRSPDGKIMPYQPYSSEQTAWINLIFAKPGSGKSVLMNMCNLALCLAPGIQRLPRIAIIDVGPSSSGLISLIRESLPPSQRHLVVHRHLRMSEREAINPFDTQLGCRYPTAPEMAFLRNFLTLVVTDFNEESATGPLPNLVSAVLEEMYSRRSDKGEPYRYNARVLSEVDEALNRYQIPTDPRTTWWEIVDELFKAGEYKIAGHAQRLAVPLLADAVTAVQSEKITDAYGEIRVPSTNEFLTAAFSRKISDALGFFPILSRPTVFDLGDARVAALDLNEVSQGGGQVSDRITAVMYMLARQILAKDFYMTQDVVHDMPAPSHIVMRDTVPVSAIRAYHVKRIKEIREDPKRICYDEFHRTKNAKMVREQVLLDMREGRKWQVDVMLASQDLSDFDDMMVKFATGN
jgi:intracellular multiplication protein IcmB